MCTVTWVHGAHGYDLFCNRDERHERGAEIAAAPRDAGGVRWIAPLDGDFGGTWIAVNEHGVAISLLNAYADSLGPTPDAWTSRGQLVSGVADVASLDDLVGRLEGDDLSVYQPFVVVALEPARPATVFHWNGLALDVDRDAEARMPLVSSGVQPEEARKLRSAVLAELREDGLSPQVLRAFHGSHAGGPSALSPCMHRDDASTRSSCHISVDGGTVSLVHTQGPPCVTPPSDPVRLERRSGTRG